MRVLINFSTLKTGGGQNVALNFLYFTEAHRVEKITLFYLVAKNSEPHRYLVENGSKHYIAVSRNALKRILFFKVDPFVKTKNSIFKVTVLSLCFSCFYQNIPLPVSYYQETDVVFPGYKSLYSY